MFETNTFLWQGENGWLMPERLNRDEGCLLFANLRDMDIIWCRIRVMNGCAFFQYIWSDVSLIDGFNFDATNQTVYTRILGIVWTIDSRAAENESMSKEMVLYMGCGLVQSPGKIKRGTGAKGSLRPVSGEDIRINLTLYSYGR